MREKTHAAKWFFGALLRRAWFPGLLVLLWLVVWRVVVVPKWESGLSGMAALIELTGVMVGLLAAWLAFRAERKAADSLDQLERSSLIVREVRDDFQEIFDRHVVAPLSESDLEKAWLLLSTPAFGFPVVGADSFRHFYDKLTNNQANLDIILFSPDAHYFHLANAQIWWRIVKPASVNSGAPDYNPVVFAHSIADVLDTIAQKMKTSVGSASPNSAGSRHNLWVINETTMRVFAYRSSQRERAALRFSERAAPRSRVYVSFSDRVTLSCPQWRVEGAEGRIGSGFRGRSLPMLQHVHGMLVDIDDNKRDNFFDQMKRCQYSLKTKDDAKVNITEIDDLQRDFILLRTHQKLFDYPCFRQEIGLVLDSVGDAKSKFNGRSATKSNGTGETSKEDDLKTMIANTCYYFVHFIGAGAEDSIHGKECPADGKQPRSLAHDVSLKQAMSMWLGLYSLGTIPTFAPDSVVNPCGIKAAEVLRTWLFKEHGLPTANPANDRLVYQSLKGLAKKAGADVHGRLTDLWDEKKRAGEDLDKAVFALYCLLASGLGDAHFRAGSLATTGAACVA